MLSIADISLIIRWIESQIGHRDLDSPYNLYVILKSCDLEGHLDLCGQLQGKWIFYLFRLIFPFIAPSILDQITLILQQWLLKRNFRLQMYYVMNIFRLAYLRYFLSYWTQISFSKIRLMICICILTWYVIK